MKMKTALPLFYFKPTICWVDDDRLFLDAASLSFGEHYHCNTFNSPSEAIKYFNEYRAPLSVISFKREFSESDLFGSANHHPVDIDMTAIAELANNAACHDEIAVLIVDYHMAEMNGVDLCERLKNFNGKKILLTGEATHEKAIEAFNKGIIDKFIRKGHNIAETLQQYVKELVYQYFCERTAALVEHLEASRRSVLSDKSFIEFFNKWCSENNIEEYYLLNKQGAFLVKDKAGAISHFVLHSENDNREFAKLNDELTGEAAQLTADVASGKLIPFFGIHKEYWEVEETNWSPYFYPTQTFSGREQYFWAVV